MRVSLLCQMALAALAASSSATHKAKKQASYTVKKQTITKPPFFCLAGDSTTAPGGGWGNGFLTTLTGGAIGTNFGHNGDTTESFVADGSWANVIAAIKKNAAAYTPICTLQFGHNDQKPENHINVTQFAKNMKALAREVTAAGGIPILVTSLSRRKFKAGVVKPDLAEQVQATLAVAAELKTAVIDLNAASMKYLNAIGEKNARTYDKESKTKESLDSTHINPRAGLLFGNMVAGLIGASSVGPTVKSFLNENAAIKAAIEGGKYILPTV